MIKGACRDGKFNISDIIVDDFTAPQDTGYITKNDIRLPCVHVLADADYRWQLVADRGNPFLDMVNFFTVRNEHQHHFSGSEAYFNDNVTKQATACLLVIGTDAEAACYRLDAVHDLVVFFVLDETGLHVDDTMAAACIKSAN
ncbi:hypothetical protein D3C81_1676690 [compost metagenome]